MVTNILFSCRHLTLLLTTYNHFLGQPSSLKGVFSTRYLPLVPMDSELSKTAFNFNSPLSNQPTPVVACRIACLVCTQHTAHCTIFLVPLGAAVPEAYGRRAVEVRFLHGPPLWDVATLSLTLTLTLTL